MNQMHDLVHLLITITNSLDRDSVGCLLGLTPQGEAAHIVEGIGCKGASNEFGYILAILTIGIWLAVTMCLRNAPPPTPIIVK